jgi:hypothetical protein
MELLGEGGTGQTWLCQHHETARRVAVKFVPRPLPPVLLPLISMELQVRGATLAHLGEDFAKAAVGGFGVWGGGQALSKAVVERQRQSMAHAWRRPAYLHLLSLPAAVAAAIRPERGACGAGAAGVRDAEPHAPGPGE